MHNIALSIAMKNKETYIDNMLNKPNHTVNVCAGEIN